MPGRCGPQKTSLPYTGTTTDPLSKAGPPRAADPDQPGFLFYKERAGTLGNRTPMAGVQTTPRTNDLLLQPQQKPRGTNGLPATDYKARCACRQERKHTRTQRGLASYAPDTRDRTDPTRGTLAGTPNQDRTCGCYARNEQ